MTNIYDQHTAAFSNVSAFVIMKDGERVATVAFKFPKDGAGRLWCYLHVIGLEMVRAYAGGYGYDKRSAAFDHATRKLKPYKWPKGVDSAPFMDHEKEMNALMDRFQAIAKDMGGKDWTDALRDAGFTVLEAV